MRDKPSCFQSYTRSLTFALRGACDTLQLQQHSLFRFIAGCVQRSVSGVAGQQDTPALIRRHDHLIGGNARAHTHTLPCGHTHSLPRKLTRLSNPFLAHTGNRTHAYAIITRAFLVGCTHAYLAHECMVVFLMCTPPLRTHSSVPAHQTLKLLEDVLATEVAAFKTRNAAAVKKSLEDVGGSGLLCRTRCVDCSVLYAVQCVVFLAQISLLQSCIADGSEHCSAR